MTTNPPTVLLDHQWIHSDQAVEYLRTIKDRNENQLRDFCKSKNIDSTHRLISFLHLALLFPPTFSAGSIRQQYRYKILLAGETGAGKTSLLRALMSKEFSTSNIQPTLGIQSTSIYWPVRINQANTSVFLFRLDFWDVGHMSSSRFDYIDKVKQKIIRSIFFFIRSFI